MGRKIHLIEKRIKGPGRKSKKQKDPIFTNETLKGLKEEDAPTKISHKQKIRAKKRESSAAEQIVLRSKGSARNTKPRKVEHEQKPMCIVLQDESNLSLKSKVSQNSKTFKVEKKKNNVTFKEFQKYPELIRDILASDDEDTADRLVKESRIAKCNNFLKSDDSGSDTEELKEDESMLLFEHAGKKLRNKRAQKDHLSREELEYSIVNREKFVFPSNNQVATGTLQDIHIRIKDVIGVLVDFSVNRDENYSRAEYIDLLCKDLCAYYSYNMYFMQLLLKLFPPNQLLEFLEASEIQRPLTIRTNSLKTRRRDLAQALINRGANLDPLGNWSKEGLVVYTSQVPLGATPEYLAGHYMIQGASSMLPVLALAPEENERILDLCAAPGGKSSHIAALMKNTGVLFSNDVNKERLQAVVGNFHRLGIQNSIITNLDGTKYAQVMRGFDRVLLDAPCSGSGVISKDPSVKTTKTEIDIQRCYNLQRKLLLTAIDCLSATSESGGFLVYSTCSILPQENEWVIDYALRKRNVRLVSTGLDIGTEGLVNFAGYKYHPSMKLTRRFYPHTYNMDGFFVAKLQKFSDVHPSKVLNNDEDQIVEENENSTIESPNKIDRRNWYFKDIAEKRPKIRVDSKHVVKIFQKPLKRKNTSAEVTNNWLKQ